MPSLFNTLVATAALAVAVKGAPFPLENFSPSSLISTKNAEGSVVSPYTTEAESADASQVLGTKRSESFSPSSLISTKNAEGSVVSPYTAEAESADASQILGTKRSDC